MTDRSSRKPARPRGSGRTGGRAVGRGASYTKGASNGAARAPLPQSTVVLYNQMGRVDRLKHPQYVFARLVEWPQRLFKDGQIDAEDRQRVKRQGYENALKSLNADERKDLARKAIERRRQWVLNLERIGLARRLRLTCKTPMIVHIASTGPLELGMALHHVYGFPVIPATSLKGLAHAHRPDDIRIYGDKETAGVVSILDGLPLDYQVGKDIMTPHSPKWYQGERDAADDADSPIPIPFLCIKPDSQFESVLLARDKESAAADLEAVTEDLRDALDGMGIGAKTSAGYGAMAVEVVPLARSDGAASQRGAETGAGGQSGFAPGFREKLERIKALPAHAAGQIGEFLERCLLLEDPDERLAAAKAIEEKMGAKFVRQNAKNKEKWRKLTEILQSTNHS